MATADDSHKALKEAAERFEAASRNLANSGNQSTITINAGGVAVWVATTACAVMLACNVFLAVLYVDQQRQIDGLQEYLSAVYMLAPSLKPKDYKGK